MREGRTVKRGCRMKSKTAAYLFAPYSVRLIYTQLRKVNRSNLLPPESACVSQCGEKWIFKNKDSAQESKNVYKLRYIPRL